MVEMRLSLVEAVAAEEAQARRVAGHGEAQGERAVVVQMLRQARRIDRDFVGQRAQRRQHAGAADDEAGGGFLHHLKRGAFLQVEHPADVAAALQVDQRMGQHEVVLGDVAMIAPHVFGEFRLAAAEIVGRPGPAGERHVHEVGRAAHHAAGRARPGQHHLPPPHQILAASGG